jgi:imidazolonepropionase-like amidohydrolase
MGKSLQSELTQKSRQAPNIYYGAKVIKLVADNSPFHYSEEDIRAAVDEAHRAGLAVAVHVTSDDPTRAVVNGGADSVEHGYYLTPEVLQLMKEKGTYLSEPISPLNTCSHSRESPISIREPPLASSFND